MRVLRAAAPKPAEKVTRVVELIDAAASSTGYGADSSEIVELWQKVLKLELSNKELTKSLGAMETAAKNSDAKLDKLLKHVSLKD